MKTRSPILGDNRPILWIGNGIARAFEGDSWKKIIEKAIKKYKCMYSSDETVKLPSSFQISAVTNNNVQLAMKEFIPMKNRLIQNILQRHRTGVG